jgi:hypothetical protein
MAEHIVHCGDEIRFSVALLRQMYEEPDHLSVLVTVVEIRLEPNGAKTLVLHRELKADDH